MLVRQLFATVAGPAFLLFAPPLPSSGGVRGDRRQHRLGHRRTAHQHQRKRGEETAAGTIRDTGKRPARPGRRQRQRQRPAGVLRPGVRRHAFCPAERLSQPGREAPGLGLACGGEGGVPEKRVVVEDVGEAAVAPSRSWLRESLVHVGAAVPDQDNPLSLRSGSRGRLGRRRSRGEADHRGTRHGCCWLREAGNMAGVCSGRAGGSHTDP